MIRVYIASKTQYAGQFLDYRAAWQREGLDLHCRWFQEVLNGEAQGRSEKDLTPEECRKIWFDDAEDIASSDFLIIYGSALDRLRGAFVEAGMALALGIPVIVVGATDFGTWIHHPLCERVANFEEAKVLIKSLMPSEEYYDTSAPTAATHSRR